MPITYIRLTGRDVWHFRSDCHHVPDRADRAFIVRKTKPRSGEFCNECRSKARADKRLKRKRG